MQRLASIAALTGLISMGLACGSGTENNNGGGTPADVSIVMGASTLGFQAYAPDTFHVSLADGGQVSWKNNDLSGPNGIVHTVTDTATAPTFGTTVAPKETKILTFAAVGEYAYHCSIHPGMRGLIVVDP